MKNLKKRIKLSLFIWKHLLLSPYKWNIEEKTHKLTPFLSYDDIDNGWIDIPVFPSYIERHTANQYPYSYVFIPVLTFPVFLVLIVWCLLFKLILKAL